MGKVKRIWRESQHPRDAKGRFSRRGGEAWIKHAATEIAEQAGSAATRDAAGRPRISRQAKAGVTLQAHADGGRPSAVRVPQAVKSAAPSPKNLADFNAQRLPTARKTAAPTVNVARFNARDDVAQGHVVDTRTGERTAVTVGTGRRLPRPAPGAAALIAARREEQAPHMQAMIAARTTPETVPVQGAESYAAMRRHTLLALARDAGVSIRGKTNTQIANELAAHDAKVKADRAAKLNPSGIGAPTGSPSARIERHGAMTAEQFRALPGNERSAVDADLNDMMSGRYGNDVRRQARQVQNRLHAQTAADRPRPESFLAANRTNGTDATVAQALRSEPLVTPKRLAKLPKAARDSAPDRASGIRAGAVAADGTVTTPDGKVIGRLADPADRDTNGWVTVNTDTEPAMRTASNRRSGEGFPVQVWLDKSTQRPVDTPRVGPQDGGMTSTTPETPAVPNTDHLKRPKAKKGDLVVVEETTADYSTSGGGRTERTEVRVGVVTSTDRDGRVTGWSTHADGSYPQKVTNRQKTYKLEQERVDVQAAMAAAAANPWNTRDGATGKPFASVEEARAAVRPHVGDQTEKLKAARAAAPKGREPMKLKVGDVVTFPAFRQGDPPVTAEVIDAPFAKGDQRNHRVRVKMRVLDGPNAGKEGYHEFKPSERPKVSGSTRGERAMAGLMQNLKATLDEIDAENAPAPRTPTTNRKQIPRDTKAAMMASDAVLARDGRPIEAKPRKAAPAISDGPKYQTLFQRLGDGMTDRERLEANLRREEQHQQLRQREAEDARLRAEARANDTRPEREKLAEQLQQDRMARDIGMRSGRLDPRREARIKKLEARIEEIDTADRKAQIKGYRKGDKVKTTYNDETIEVEVVGKTSDGYLRILLPNGKRGNLHPKFIEGVTPAPKADAAPVAAPARGRISPDAKRGALASSPVDTSRVKSQNGGMTTTTNRERTGTYTGDISADRAERHANTALTDHVRTLVLSANDQQGPDDFGYGSSDQPVQVGDEVMVHTFGTWRRGIVTQTTRGGANGGNTRVMYSTPTGDHTVLETTDRTAGIMRLVDPSRRPAENRAALLPKMQGEVGASRGARSEEAKANAKLAKVDNDAAYEAWRDRRELEHDINSIIQEMEYTERRGGTYGPADVFNRRGDGSVIELAVRMGIPVPRRKADRDPDALRAEILKRIREHGAPEPVADQLKAHYLAANARMEAARKGQPLTDLPQAPNVPGYGRGKA